MATTVDAKPHSPSNRSGTNRLGSVKARISALVSSLRHFDVSTIERRDDWKADAFASLFNATLADIFGQDSQEYGEYSVRSFDALPPGAGVEYLLPEVRQGYQKGINTAVRKLNLLLDDLDKKEGSAEEVPPPARQAEATSPSVPKEKVSLVARRAELKNRQAPPAMADGAAPGRGKAVKAAPEIAAGVEWLMDGQPDEPQPVEVVAGAMDPGKTDIPGNNGKGPNQHEDLDVDECLEAMQRALERVKSGQKKGAQVEPEPSEPKAEEETRQLEPKGFVSEEFSHQEPAAWSLPDEPPEDEPGKEALLAGDMAIVLGDDELPEPVVEDRQEATPWSPGAELTVEVLAEHLEAFTALSSLDPLRLAEVAITTGEENDCEVAPYSAYLDEERIGYLETGLPEPGEQAVYGELTESRAGRVGGSSDRPKADASWRSWGGMKARISALVSSMPARHQTAATIQLGTQMEEGSGQLESERFVSAESPHQETSAWSLPDEAPREEPGKEALLAGDEAIVLGDDELPEPMVEDRQETTPWSPGAELAPEMEQDSRQLEPDGFDSAEFSHQEPCAGSLPDEALKDGPGKEALTPGDEVIVLGDDELAGPMVEDRQETTPWSPGAELAPEMVAEQVEPITPLASLDPLRSAEVAMAVGEEDVFQVAPYSAHLEEERIEDLETGLSQPGEQAASDAAASEHLQEESSTFEHDPFPHAAAEQAAEPQGHEIPAHEILSVEEWPNEPETSGEAVTFDAVEDEVPPASLEQAGEPISLDLGDVEALADRFTKEMAGPSEPKAPVLPEERLSGDTVPVPAAHDQASEAPPAENPVQAAPQPVIEAPEVQQNPFAIRDSEKQQSKPKITGADGLRAQIKAITERIDDLKRFDVTTVTERFDPRARELRDSVNNTIADVFGRNTPSYWHHSLPEFDAIPVVLGSPRPPSPEEVRGSYVRAIGKAVTKLTTIVGSLKQRLEKLELGTDSERKTAAAPSASDHERGATAVEQQEGAPSGAEPPAAVKGPAQENAVERPAERVVIKAREIEQNPFAIRDSEKKQSRPKVTGPTDLQAQVGAIMERINDLRSFDAAAVTQRHDPKARQLCDSVNSTLADVFGRNTPAYWHHSLPSFETSHVILGSPYRSPDELRRSYEEGINKAVTKLTAIAESLKSKLGQSESRRSP